MLRKMKDKKGLCGRIICMLKKMISKFLGGGV